jgi:hypothetical protein
MAPAVCDHPEARTKRRSLLIKESLADIVRNPETRLGRAVALYEEHGDEIVSIGGGIYLVPSSDGVSYYRVDYTNETCACPDANHHPEATCKHVLIIGIARAKRRGRRLQRGLARAF